MQKFIYDRGGLTMRLIEGVHTMAATKKKAAKKPAAKTAKKPAAKKATKKKAPAKKK